MKKVQFKLEGFTYIIPSECVRDHGDGTPEIYLNAKATASVIKQFVKQKYPGIKVWAKSETYSGGNSVDIHVYIKPGQDRTAIDSIRTFANNLRSGQFNGMTDSYEYNRSVLYSDKGTQIRPGGMFIYVDDRPPYGSKEYEEWEGSNKEEK